MHPLLEGELPVSVGTNAFVARRVKSDPWKRSQCCSILIEQFPDLHIVAVVFASMVFLATKQQSLVVRINRFKLRNRHQQVSPVIADLVLHVAFLIACGRVAEHRFETEVLLETQESFSERSLTVFQNLRDHRRGVVKPHLQRNPADVGESRNQADEKTLQILPFEHLQEPRILIVGGTRLRFDGPGPIISDVGGVE